jgi:hypothetical protein
MRNFAILGRAKTKPKQTQFKANFNGKIGFATPFAVGHPLREPGYPNEVF